MEVSVTCSLCSKVMNHISVPQPGNDVKFISYYTKDTPYKREADRLESSLRRLGLNYEIEEVPDLGDWKLNARFKAQFVRDRVGEQPVVWLDADSIVWEHPMKLMHLDCDFAHTYSHPDKLNGAVHYWAPTPNAIALADRWVEVCIERNTKDSFERDQKCLQYAMDELADSKCIQVEVLPVEYCFIFDTHRRKNPRLTPIIEQFQASRAYRRKKKKKK